MVFCGVLSGLVFLMIAYGRIPNMVLIIASTTLCILWIVFYKRVHTHDGFLSLDTYAQRSKLRAYNPSVKTFFAVFCAVLCVAVDKIFISLFFFVTMALIAILIAKTPAAYFFRLFSAPLLFILLGSAAMLVEVAKSPVGILNLKVWADSYLIVTAQGQQRALCAMMRAIGAVSCMYTLSLTTPIHQIIAVLRRARIPAMAVELMYLIYRYIFVMLDTFENMKVAAAARNGFRNFSATIRTSMLCALNLLYLSFKRSSDCYSAMESRCYDGDILFLDGEALSLGKEVVFVAVYFVLLAVFWIGVLVLKLYS